MLIDLLLIDDLSIGQVVKAAFAGAAGVTF
jgi:hypothetical protein